MLNLIREKGALPHLETMDRNSLTTTKLLPPFVDDLLRQTLFLTITAIEHTLLCAPPSPDEMQDVPQFLALLVVLALHLLAALDPQKDPILVVEVVLLPGLAQGLEATGARVDHHMIREAGVEAGA